MRTLNLERVIPAVWAIFSGKLLINEIGTSTPYNSHHVGILFHNTPFASEANFSPKRAARQKRFCLESFVLSFGTMPNTSYWLWCSAANSSHLQEDPSHVLFEGCEDRFCKWILYIVWLHEMTMAWINCTVCNWMEVELSIFSSRKPDFVTEPLDNMFKALYSS